MAYTPISTMFNTPYSSTTVLSPLTPVTLSPLPPITTAVTQSVIVNNDPLTVVTPIGPVLYNVGGPRYLVDIDTGINDNYIVQRDVTRGIMYKVLDKWLYDDFPNILKYLVVEKDTVRLVKSEQEKENNKVSSNTVSELEAKSDYIGDNILTESAMREILVRIMRETGLKWYELPHREQLLKDVVEKYLKKKLRKHLE
jgi:hypothetical protein